jgi:hypothetical protein
MSAQQPVTKGYSDGFLSAKIFALYGLSKLGFIGQYINDSIVALGSGTDGITPGTEDIYRQWFLRGLQDGEATVVYVLTKK